MFKNIEKSTVLDKKWVDGIDNCCNHFMIPTSLTIGIRAAQWSNCNISHFCLLDKQKNKPYNDNQNRFICLKLFAMFWNNDHEYDVEPPRCLMNIPFPFNTIALNHYIAICFNFFFFFFSLDCSSTDSDLLLVALWWWCCCCCDFSICIDFFMVLSVFVRISNWLFRFVVVYFSLRVENNKQWTIE